MTDVNGLSCVILRCLTATPSFSRCLGSSRCWVSRTRRNRCIWNWSSTGTWIFLRQKREWWDEDSSFIHCDENAVFSVGIQRAKWNRAADPFGPGGSCQLLLINPLIGNNASCSVYGALMYSADFSFRRHPAWKDLKLSVSERHLKRLCSYFSFPQQKQHSNLVNFLPKITSA